MIDFLRQQHLNKDFLQRFLAVGYPKKYPFKIRLNSDDCLECALWINKNRLKSV